MMVAFFMGLLSLARAYALRFPFFSRNLRSFTVTFSEFLEGQLIEVMYRSLVGRGGRSRNEFAYTLIRSQEMFDLLPFGNLRLRRSRPGTPSLGNNRD